MLLIRPKVVVIIAALGNVRDFVLRIEHRQDVVFNRLKLRRRQLFFRCFVVAAHPLQRFFAANVFQPQVRIVLRGGLLRRGLRGGGQYGQAYGG